MFIIILKGSAGDNADVVSQSGSSSDEQCTNDLGTYYYYDSLCLHALMVGSDSDSIANQSDQESSYEQDMNEMYNYGIIILTIAVNNSFLFR